MDPPYSKFRLIYEYLENERISKKKSEKHAEDIMTHKIISISSQSTIKDAVELMNEHQISQLPIINKDQNIGSITSKRIQKFITSTGLINISIIDIKELPFPEVENTWNVEDISNLLINYPAVLVKDSNHQYVGIITDADFLKLT